MQINDCQRKLNTTLFPWSLEHLKFLYKPTENCSLENFAFSVGSETFNNNSLISLYLGTEIGRDIMQLSDSLPSEEDKTWICNTEMSLKNYPGAGLSFHDCIDDILKEDAQQLITVLSEAVKVRVQKLVFLCQECKLNKHSLMDDNTSVLKVPESRILQQCQAHCSKLGHESLSNTADLVLCKVCECSQLSKSSAHHSTCSRKSVSCCHAKVAVLFSGGLDSAVLAALADR